MFFVRFPLSFTHRLSVAHNVQLAAFRCQLPLTPTPFFSATPDVSSLNPAVITIFHPTLRA